jgi:DNA-binding CsgD family transcriptional regulator
MSRLPRPPPGLEAEVLHFHGADLAVLSWPTRPAAIPPGLTAAETEVVRLASQGLSNAEIGGRRGCAGRTVANQLASAFSKLGVGSRAELAALLARGEDAR